jgi:hypothetical protein
MRAKYVTDLFITTSIALPDSGVLEANETTRDEHGRLVRIVAILSVHTHHSLRASVMVRALELAE